MSYAFHLKKKKNYSSLGMKS